MVAEVVPGAARERPGLDRLLDKLQPGDVLALVRLDRSLPHLIDVIRRIEGKGAGPQSFGDAIDTVTAGWRLIFHLVGAIGSSKRAQTVERSHAGLKEARKRGVKVGWPAKLTAVAMRAPWSGRASPGR